jgi:hypothetical protein
MKELLSNVAKNFDPYSFSARVKPAFFIVLPVALVFFVWYEPSKTLAGGIITLLSTFGVIQYAANLISSKGNALQSKLFTKWGGSPTTIIMRHTDDTIDKHTKKRLFTALTSKCSGLKFPTVEEEKEVSEDADEVYKSAGNFIKENSRDTKKYPLVFKELVAYGISRNTRAFKALGILISLITLVISIFLLWFNYLYDSQTTIIEIINIAAIEELILPIFLSVFLYVWIFTITEKEVKIRAYAYAKALLAVGEKL